MQQYLLTENVGIKVQHTEDCYIHVYTYTYTYMYIDNPSSLINDDYKFIQFISAAYSYKWVILMK